MSARYGLVGKNPPGPVCGHLGSCFLWAGKIGKHKFFAYFCYFTDLGPLLLSTRGGAIGIDAGVEETLLNDIVVMVVQPVGGIVLDLVFLF